jgi:pimeloyl-ACP methyl ester carboxylesterase
LKEIAAEIENVLLGTIERRECVMGFQNNATVVFVPGGWADGSSWDSVINSVSEAGLKVACAPIPLSSLGNDVAAVKRVIARSEGPVLLVAHAYGGAVIAATDDEKVKGLVYITALAPDEGETVADVFYREPAHVDAPKLAPDKDGLIWMPHEGFLKAFAPHAKADVLVRLEAIQRPLHVSCIQEPLPIAAWREKPTWFLIAQEDRMIPEKTQRFMAERMKATIRSLPADHTPSVTMPKPVVDIVLEAAKATLQ